IIVMGFVGLGMAYGLATPIFEKPDEHWHMAYIASLLEARGYPAPPVVIGDLTPAQESSQPPLYYTLAAGVARAAVSDLSDRADWLVHNPGFPYIAEETLNDNKNRLMHALPESPTYGGTPLAVFVARMVALAMGAVAVGAAYGLGREAFPERHLVALTAAATVAFLPQFLFISSSVSNDSTAAATCGLAMWATTRILRRGMTSRRAASAGLALTLAALSKASAVALMPLTLLVLAANLRRPYRDSLGQLTLVAAVPLLIAGPWYLRTWSLFGDPLGASTHLAMPWAYAEPLSLIGTIGQLPGAAVSFWLAFGWGNVLLPDALYSVLNALAFLGLAGAVIAGVRNRDRVTRLSLAYAATWIGLVFVALLMWIRVLSAPLGRLLYPALPALALLLAAGWATLASPRRMWLAALPGVCLLLVSIAALPFVLMPAYARPALFSVEQLAAQPGLATDVRFDDVARLVRVDVPRDVWPRPGQEPIVRLCWEALQSDARPLMVLVQFVGEANRVVATRRTLPGLGAFPTAAWRPGDRFCDAVRVPIPQDAPAPLMVRVEVSIIDPATRTRLPAFAPDGLPLEATFVDRMKIAPAAYAEPPIEAAMNTRFGDQIALVGYAVEASTVRPGEAVSFRLYWHALRRPQADYTVFVHLRDESGETVAQGDGPPQFGEYPASFWEAGEVVTDERVIAVPADTAPGDYALVVGLYELASGDRLLIDDETSQTEVTIGWVTVQ
ncbi:MAG TPA: DUF2142 domain-containing protein, partial [Anaerolineae bacterium]|nr:DUF2142 domain-containing protein [Anaerolineae bacterium]